MRSRLTSCEYIIGVTKDQRNFKNKVSLSAHSSLNNSLLRWKPETRTGSRRISASTKLLRTLRLRLQRICTYPQVSKISNKSAQNDIITLKSQISDFMSLNNEIKAFCLEKISESKKEILTDLSQLNDIIAEATCKDTKNNLEISNLGVKIKALDERADHFENDFSEINLLCDTFQSSKVDKTSIEKFTGNVEDQLLKYSIEYEEALNSYKHTDNFIEKYLPISTQNMISDCLKQVLQPSQINKLDEYDRIKYSKFYQAILDDDGVPNIKDLINKLLESARTRNKKQAEPEESEGDKEIADVEEVIDYNEIAIKYLDAKVTQMEAELHKKIRESETQINSLISKKDNTSSNNYSELQLLCFSLQEDLDKSKTSLRNDITRVQGELNLLKQGLDDIL
ncbi:unnamed protein product [Moneuplotes crassus]|uniref:Uncharacterized protein n=1 Tax=Euplotes crassus TaxID=5936 RepID=A0AAD1UBP6_EUPCR|nr:unnamed protein product [Moneuplotes crassus]